jgi:hypothetical protein
MEIRNETDRIKLIADWYKFRNTYNDKALKAARKYFIKNGSYSDSSLHLPTCIFCTNIYSRRLAKNQGKGCLFYRDKEGNFIGECMKGRCDGMKIPPSNYIDSATLHTELQHAKEELMKELKYIRDRVFGSENITPEDDEEFRALTREYTGIRKMEEQYKKQIDTIPFNGHSYSIEDRRPNTEGGANNDRLIFRSNKILSLKGKDKLEGFETGDMVLGVVCKDDLPVRIR